MLLDAVAGTAIDAHDTVIRFNAAPTKVYARPACELSFGWRYKEPGSLPWQDVA